MNDSRDEAPWVLVLGAMVFAALAIFSTDSYGAKEKSFCDDVADISTALAFKSEADRETTYEVMEHWMPMLARHVKPATKAAVNAKNNGYAANYIRAGIYNHCKTIVEDA